MPNPNISHISGSAGFIYSARNS